jgi:hypothetical protein
MVFLSAARLICFIALSRGRWIRCAGRAASGGSKAPQRSGGASCWHPAETKRFAIGARSHLRSNFSRSDLAPPGCKFFLRLRTLQRCCENFLCMHWRNGTLCYRVAMWYICIPEVIILVCLGRPRNGNFGKFHDHLVFNVHWVYFKAVFYILWLFGNISPVLVCCAQKIWPPCCVIGARSHLRSNFSRSGLVYFPRPVL